jgi:hypothetical protein
MEFLFRVYLEKYIQELCSFGFFVAAERNQIDEFFTQSSLTQKPVVSD